MSFKLSVLITFFFALSAVAAPSPQRGGGGFPGGGGPGGGGSPGGVRPGPQPPRPGPVRPPAFPPIPTVTRKPEPVPTKPVPTKPVSTKPVPTKPVTVVPSVSSTPVPSTPVSTPLPSATPSPVPTAPANCLAAKQIDVATLAAPTGTLSSLVIGVGVQNYTCSDAGTYAAAGAVAQLFDIACLEEADFDSIPDRSMAAWSASTASATSVSASDLGLGNLATLGSHFFIASGTGISPVWDYRAGAGQGDPNAFVLAARVAGVPAPTGSNDVDWLQLKNVSGGLASAVYRTETRQGKAPASCTPGSAPISVKYTSVYSLFS